MLSCRFRLVLLYSIFSSDAYAHHDASSGIMENSPLGRHHSSPVEKCICRRRSNADHHDKRASHRRSATRSMNSHSGRKVLSKLNACCSPRRNLDSPSLRSIPTPAMPSQSLCGVLRRPARKLDASASWFFTPQTPLTLPYDSLCETMMSRSRIRWNTP